MLLFATVIKNAFCCNTLHLTAQFPGLNHFTRYRHVNIHSFVYHSSWVTLFALFGADEGVKPRSLSSDEYHLITYASFFIIPSI